MNYRAASPALLAALLFGASTPLAKLLGAEMPPLLLAGLLYLGSGLGLSAAMLVRRWFQRGHEGDASTLAIPRAEIPWLAGAILAGGVLGPALLMFGLATSGAAAASLLLNLEGVLTALIAWGVFREHTDRHIVAGMAAILLGGAVLSWQPGEARLSAGAVLIVAACLCWAIDNNLTRKVSSNDAMLIACLKGIVAGTCNASLALAGGAKLPEAGPLIATLLVGFGAYGLSLVLFVIALRTLGTARTGAYFSVAPLFGVVLSLVIWPTMPGWTFWVAAGLMAFGVWLHVRERHAHGHTHHETEHAHPHSHDEHHQHTHDFPWDGDEPHVHQHRHVALTHRHAHFPDLHHRHEH